MSRKSFYIGVLSLTATVLALLNYFVAQPAQAELTIKDRDFSMVTSREQNGGESLWVLDNMTGHVAIFYYDPSGRALRAREVRDVGTQVFSPPGPPRRTP